ncbi:MAG: DUF2750 domain-containing protein [Pseudomonadota bacterium]
MHEKQIENLLNHSAQERVDYFIRYCADFEAVWGVVVGEDNWAIINGVDDDEIFLVWPHEKLVEHCMFDEHREMNATPQAISIDAFINHCIPDMARQEVLFGVFFGKDRQGMALPAETLKLALEKELAEHTD